MAAVAVWARIDLLTASGATLATWVFRGQGAPDLGVVEVLARWQLYARRSGVSIRLREVCDDLEALLQLVGLREEFGGGSGLPI